MAFISFLPFHVFQKIGGPLVMHLYFLVSWFSPVSSSLNCIAPARAKRFGLWGFHSFLELECIALLKKKKVSSINNVTS